MSVYASMKEVPHDQAFLDIVNLVKYTLTITQSKVFYIKPPTAQTELISTDGDKTCLPKQFCIAVQRHPLAERLDALVLDIYQSAWHSWKDMTTPEARRKQYLLREEVICSFDDLLWLMQMAKAVFHLKPRRLEYWTGLVLKAEGSFTDLCLKEGYNPDIQPESDVSAMLTK